MNIVVRDVDLLGAIVPDHVKAYLKANGWAFVGRFPSGNAEAWKTIAKGGFEVKATVLTDRELGDFAERNFELLQTIAGAEGRSHLSIYEDIQRVPWDAVAVRSEHPASLDGSIPWREGVRLHDGVQGMLVAGALSTVEARPIHPSARPQPVKEYASQLRMGQTSRGSYIVNALSPLRIPSDPPLQAPLFPEHAPSPGFGRRAMDTLVDALEATRRAAQIGAKTLSPDAFVEAVSQGISANLLESIAETVHDSEGRVHVSVRWSPLAARPSDAIHRVTFEPLEVRVIDSAGKHFRATYPELDVELEGFVVRVDRTTPRLGDIIALEAFVRGKVRRVALDLFGKGYEIAILALKLRNRVRFKGTLIKEGRGFKLLGPQFTGFEWPESNDDAALEISEEDRAAMAALAGMALPSTTGQPSVSTPPTDDAPPTPVIPQVATEGTPGGQDTSGNAVDATGADADAGRGEPEPR